MEKIILLMNHIFKIIFKFKTMKNLTVIVLLLFNMNLFAQDYYYLPKVSTTSEYVFNNLGPYYWQGNATGQPDTLLERTLPFSWKFYGQAVTTVKISDNGYITFDPAEIKSNPNNESLPSANAPKNAIFALWDALVNVDPDGLSSYTNLIHTWTYGTAPNRVFVIHWFRMFHEPYTSSNVSQFCFGIRIFESGAKAFDIVMDYNYLPSGGTVVTTTATVGIQNADATKGIMISGSPAFNFPNVTSANTDDVVYEFYEGTQAQYDLALVSLKIADMANFNRPNQVGGVVRNLGQQTINSFNINYLVDGNSTTNTINQTIKSGEEYTFTADAYVPNSGSGQQHEIKVWVSNLNGSQTDENHNNDTLNKSVFVNLGVSATKRVLIEEFTTVPCGFCPDGHLKLEEILTNYLDVIGVCHHAGFGTDAMTTSFHSTYATDFADGAPTAAIDRHKFDGDNGNIAISRNIWEASAATRLTQTAPCRVQTFGTYNSTSRQLSITAQAEFVDYALPGDLRLTVWLVEDHVSEGTGTNWDQHSYYYNTSGHPMYQVGIYNGSYAYIPKYDHRWVSRAVLSPPWGTPGLFGTNPKPGDIKTYNYNYTLPANWNSDSVYIVAFVSYYNTDKSKRDIINSFRVRLPLLPSAAVSINEPEISSASAISIYPNPVNNYTSLTFTLTENADVSYEVFNALGKKIMSSNTLTYASGENTIYINTMDIENGTYILKLKTGDKTFTTKFIK